MSSKKVNQLKDSAFRSKSLANLNGCSMDEAAAGSTNTLRKRRWKAMASSIRRFVKQTSSSNAGSPVSPVANCLGGLQEAGLSQSHTTAMITMMTSPKDIDESCVGKKSSQQICGQVSSNIYAACSATTDAVWASSSSPSSSPEALVRSEVVEDIRSSTSGAKSGHGAVERFWMMRHRNSKNGLDSRGKSHKSSPAYVVHGLAADCVEVPAHALCVNPHFMAFFRGTSVRADRSPVFLTAKWYDTQCYQPAPPLALSRPSTSCSIISTDNASPNAVNTPTPPLPTYEEITRTAAEIATPQSSFNVGRMCSTSDGSLHGSVEGDSGSHSDTSSGCSYSSTSCATWSQDPTPAHGVDMGRKSKLCRTLSTYAGQLDSSMNARPLPPTPLVTSSDMFMGDAGALLRKGSEYGCDSEATVSPISQSSSASSLYRLDERSYLLENFDAIKSLNWYWGPLSRENSEAVLAGAAVGDFLLRDSNNETHYFVLSVKCSKEIFHILTDNTQLDMEWPMSASNHVLDTLSHLHPKITINKEAQASIKLPTSEEIFLVSPCLRHEKVPSLQHLCRLALRGKHLLHRDNVEKLQLPSGIKKFLDERNVFPSDI